MPSNQTRPQVSVRVDPEVLRAISNTAAAEQRTISNMVRVILAGWAQGRDGERVKSAA
jgi:hypothetical protein